MSFQEYLSIVQLEQEPNHLNPFLLALWHDAKGNWEKAHDLIQDMDEPDGAWVHAYLHRKEGDEGNARYWYSRAGKKLSNLSLAAEWDELAKHFLAHPNS